MSQQFTEFHCIATIAVAWTTVPCIEINCTKLLLADLHCAVLQCIILIIPNWVEQQWCFTKYIVMPLKLDIGGNPMWQLPGLSRMSSMCPPAANFTFTFDGHCILHTLGIVNGCKNRLAVANNSLSNVWCRMLQPGVCNSQCVVCSMQCLICRVQFKVFSVQCATCSMQCAIFSLKV